MRVDLVLAHSLQENHEINEDDLVPHVALCFSCYFVVAVYGWSHSCPENRFSWGCQIPQGGVASGRVTLVVVKTVALPPMCYTPTSLEKALLAGILLTTT